MYVCIKCDFIIMQAYHVCDFIVDPWMFWNYSHELVYFEAHGCYEVSVQWQ